MDDQIGQFGNAPLEELTSNELQIQPPPPGIADWQAAEAAVRRCCVNQFKAAVEFVRDRGGQPADVLAVVEYWRKHRGRVARAPRRRHSVQAIRTLGAWPGCRGVGVLGFVHAGA